jgi:hypothetical protein
VLKLRTGRRLKFAEDDNNDVRDDDFFITCIYLLILISYVCQRGCTGNEYQ